MKMSDNNINKNKFDHLKHQKKNPCRENVQAPAAKYMCRPGISEEGRGGGS